MASQARDLENWNPMAESYHDAKINSYADGPGAFLTPYARTPAATEYRLYVNNVPLELNENGIRQLFDCHAKTLSVMSPPNSCWAFVTFGSFNEAEAVIREVNNKPPLYLKVAFAKKDNRASVQQQPIHRGIPNIEQVAHDPETQHRTYLRPPQYTRPEVRNMGRGRELVEMARRVTGSQPRLPYQETDDLLYPIVHDPNLYDPYEEAEPFADTNAMWARRRIKVSNDGTRFVTMGRGHTWYKLPTPHPRVNQQIRAVYEKRESGLYEFGENRSAQQIGKCQACTQPAVMRCQRCKEFYCSRSCQEVDWPRHKVECQAMPGLEGGAESGSLSMSSGEELTLPKGPTKRSIRKLRRPLRSAEVMPPNSSSTPLPGTSPTFGVIASTCNTLEPMGKENISVQANFEQNHSDNQKREVCVVKDTNVGGWKSMNNGDCGPLASSSIQQGLNANSKTNSVNEALKQKENLNVAPVITAPKQESTLNASYGSSGFKNLRSMNSMGQNEQTNSHQPPLNFKYPIGGHGATVQSSADQISTQVKNLNIKDTDKVKPKSNLLLSDPDVSFYKSTAPNAKATVSEKESTSKEYENATAKQVTTQVAHTPQATNLPAPSISSVKTVVASPSAVGKKPAKNIVELLDVEEQGCFEVHVLLGGKKSAVTLCVLKLQAEYEKISSELSPACDNMTNNPNFKPKVGDFVCGKRMEDWIRGTVVSMEPAIRLAAVDEGRMESVSLIKPIPSGFARLPTLGAICELTDGELTLEPMGQYTFIVVNKNPSSVSKDGVEIVVFSGDDKESKGFLKPWVPAPEQKGVPYASLTSGSEVCIVSFRSHVLLCARSLVTKDMEIFNQLTQEVAKWSTKASKLTDLPFIGEMVIAKYAEDNNFYRAIVRVIKEGRITVSYVDFGNIETTTLENLRAISDKLKEYPSCAAKILLKDVPKDVPMTKEVSDYLSMLAGMEKPLVCTFDGCPAVNGVVLKEANGTCVNDKICKLLTPSWKKEVDTLTAFMSSDLEVADLGKEGETINVLVLHTYGPLMYAMAPYDMELIEHITGVMSTQIAEYCEQLKEHYIPRQHELCLAPFEGQWYRAVCMEPNTTDKTSTITFIDFGNIAVVPHTDLRLITRDFTTTKALASVCQVVELCPTDKEGDAPPAVAARLEQLLPANTIVQIKIVKSDKSGDCVVELPEIRSTLVKEGLVTM